MSRPVVWFLLAFLLAACRADEESVPSSPPETGATPSATRSATATATEPLAPAVPPTQTSKAATETEPSADADVTFVRAVQAADGSWTFHVTVEHPDTGWDDYADGWDVVTADGNVVRQTPEDQFTRLLLHPHVDEQPFTRSQSGLILPADVQEVTVRAHDLVDGFGGQTVIVDLTATSGPGFAVERGTE